MIDNELKIVLIGPFMTGKSLFFKAISQRQQSVNSQKAICDICSIHKKIDGKNVKVTILDTSGSVNYDKQRIMNMRGCHQILFFFDVHDNKKFLELREQRWLSENNLADTKIALIGNKIDRQSKIKIEQIEKLRDELKCDIYYTNSFDKERCKKVFNMIVKKLLLGEEIKKKNENDHFDKYIELLIEMDKKNDKEDENYFENLHKNFKKELLNTLEIDGVETEREEKAIKDKIKGILKQVKDLKLQKQKNEDEVQKIVKSEDKLKQKINELIEKQKVFEEEIQEVRTREEKRVKEVKQEMKKKLEEMERKSMEDKQSQSFYKSYLQKYTVLNNFKESKIIRELDHQVSSQVKQQLQKYIKKDISRLQLVYDLNKEKGQYKSLQNQENLMIIIKLKSSILILFSQNKWNQSTNGLALSILSQNQQNMKIGIWSGKQNEKSIKFFIKSITYGNDELSINLNNKNMSISNSNNPFIQANQTLQCFCYVKEKDHNISDLQILRVSEGEGE